MVALVVVKLAIEMELGMTELHRKVRSTMTCFSRWTMYKKREQKPQWQSRANTRGRRIGDRCRSERKDRTVICFSLSAITEPALGGGVQRVQTLGTSISCTCTCLCACTLPPCGYEYLVIRVPRAKLAFWEIVNSLDQIWKQYHIGEDDSRRHRGRSESPECA